MARGSLAGLGNDGRVCGELPARGGLRRDSPGAGQEAGGVVAERGIAEVGQQHAAGVLQGAAGAGECRQAVGQPPQSFVDVTIVAFDQAVGVQGEGAAGLQVDGGGLERHAAHPKGGPGETSSTLTVPSGRTATGGGWPALARAQWRATGS